MIDYKKSGVDVQAGDDLVSWLQSPSNSASDTNKNFTSNVKDYKNRVYSGIGGFAALYDISFPQFKEPMLISATDGVGTKVKLAASFGEYEGVAQDLVAMCVNDLICCGGTPLFFLDYYATGKLDLSAAKEFLSGVRVACEKSHMVLIGGETAEMPGVYGNKDFDCAGFAVGVVDRSEIWGSDKVCEGDVIVGLDSSGYHSNGFSLLRRVFENDLVENKKWLMEPTRLYVEAALDLKNKFEIHAAAHITGGGIENLPRVLPEHLKAEIVRWKMPECFQEVQKRTGMSDSEMRNTLNCGIGFIFIIKTRNAETVINRLSEIGYNAQVLGKVSARVQGEEHVVWT